MSFFKQFVQGRGGATLFEPFISGEPHKILKQYWGFLEFRQGQQEVIDSILESRDTLTVMPTGAGKSLCYQLPALILPGVTVIVSPLIALMKDQVEALSRRGLPAAFINSSLDAKEIKAILRAVQSGAVRLLYLAPERFHSQEFVTIFRKIPVKLFAIDEAHCVSHWGHDFRPDYLKLKEMTKLLPKRPIVMACTATATPEAKKDIVKQLGLLKPQIFVRGFDRPNLMYLVAQGLSERDRELLLKRFVLQLKGSGIIYAGTRNRSEELAILLQKHGIKAQAYHAGIENEERKKIQEAFMNEKIRVIVATVAFGMGIDKHNVRFVIHVQMPGSLESYYQEAGRAGRDGKPAYCILLHAWKDRHLQDYFIKTTLEDMIEQGKPKEKALAFSALRLQRLEYIEQYITKRQCRRHQILAYFDDPDASNIQSCQGCDICLGWIPTHPLPLEQSRF